VFKYNKKLSYYLENSASAWFVYSIKIPHSSNKVSAIEVVKSVDSEKCKLFGTSAAKILQARCPRRRPINGTEAQDGIMVNTTGWAKKNGPV